VAYNRKALLENCFRVHVRCVEIIVKLLKEEIWLERENRERERERERLYVFVASKAKHFNYFPPLLSGRLQSYFLTSSRHNVFRMYIKKNPKEKKHERKLNFCRNIFCCYVASKDLILFLFSVDCILQEKKCKRKTQSENFTCSDAFKLDGLINKVKISFC
jgi:hypothetical protein